MRKSLARYSVLSGIGKNLFRWFLTISLVPLLVVGFISYRSARNSLIHDTERHLSAAIELKKKYIEAFFKERISDLEIQASLAENIEFLTELRKLSRELNLSGPAFAMHPRWRKLTDRFRPDLHRLAEIYGYHEISLIDPEGNVLFNLLEGDALGSNIFTNNQHGALLKKACRKALDSGETSFSDMESLHAAGHELDSFLVRAVKNNQGEQLGLMAFELSMRQIDQLMQDRSGMGETGETFLVGNDFLMRSDSWKAGGGTALKTKVDTDLVRKWREAEVTLGAGATPKVQVDSYINHQGTKVFGVVDHLDVLEELDTHWFLVAELAETEALVLVEKARTLVFWLLIATTLVVALASIAITRGIVKPLHILSAWTGRVARGDLTPLAGPVPGNEIGELYKDFRRMVDSFQEVTEVCAAVAIGDFSKTAAPRSENDALGLAVNQMAENLRAVVKQAEVISTGDFSVQITPWSEDDKLGAALLKMTIRLREMDEANRKALAEARRLAHYVDNLPTPVVSVDRNFKIVYINGAGADFAGFSQADCLGRYCHELFRNDHCQTQDCRVGRAMRSKQIETAETYIDPHGLNLPIRYTGAPVLDEKGEVVGALEYIVDITEAKTAFLAIEKENRLQSGSAAINDRLRGDQTIKELCANLLSGLADRLDIQAGAMYIRSDESLQLCGTYGSDGSVIRDAFAIAEGLIGQAAYEKKLLRANDIPEDSVRTISGLLETAPRHLVVLPLLFEEKVKGVIELASFNALSDEDLEFLERVAANIAIAINSVQSRARLAELLDETQKQAMDLQTQQEELRVINEELEAQTHSLKEREVELQAQHEELMALNEELEEKTGALEKQKSDIMAKNLALEEARNNIEKKAEELAIASKYKSEFMANMSHELRTPLNSLLLLSHNLAQNKEGTLNADQVESATVIYNSGNDLLELINEILDLSKIEAGRVDLGLAEVSLKDFSSRLRSNFKPLLDEKALEFSIVIDPKAPATITTDRQRLDQIAKNLLSNAVKFTEKGGVTLTIRPMSANEENPPTKNLPPGRTLVIEVTDTGIGISPEKQKIVFEAFQQADGSTSRKYGGTGLGLSISRELAGLLGGEIRLASTPSLGTTFILYLPFTPPATETQEEKTRPPKPGAEPVPLHEIRAKRRQQQPALEDDRAEINPDDKTILIIEDDLNFAKNIIKQGHEKGFKCLTANNGDSGLVLAEKHRPGAIILDINLPDMSGWEILDALKKNPALRHIPVHMMSVEEKTLDAYKKGAVGYLHKPVTQDDLLKAFDRLEEVIAKDIRDLLLVEDDEILSREIIKLIGNSDVKTTSATTGAKAIKALKEKKFDCMILDIGLPDMTGFELLGRLEESEEIRIPPVIVYTGRELTKEENDSLYQYTDSIIIKGVKSVERLLDETALFLHRVVAKMPDEKRKMIANLYEQDAMFVGKKILIVDDDMRNAFALSKILAEKQMEILIADNGRKALETLEEEEADLILMDIMMPEMDGYEAIRRIRAQEKFWNLPIIALTAKAMPEDKGKCLEAGASDYLAKPIEEARLLSMMRIWLYR